MRHLPDGTAISALGLGCSSFWAKPSFAAEFAVALVKRAHEFGVNHFDTGPSYADGEAERRLGVSIRSLNRRGLVISTKAGTYTDSTGGQFRSFDPSTIRGNLQASLDRLGIEQIDILYLHGPSRDDLSPAVLGCLEDLKGRGLIRYSGVNSFDASVLDRAVEAPIDVVMPQFNIFDVSCLRQILALKAAGKTIMSGTALGQGIFDFRTLIPSSRKSLWYLLRAVKNDPLFPLTRLRAKRRVAEWGSVMPDAALLFLLQNPAITSAVFGTTSMVHLEQNLAAAERMGDRGASDRPR
jgi:D-threo-aldose 1-dehydrogenase